MCSQKFPNTVMKATTVDLTQPLKPTSLAWENPLISVKLATMCLFSSTICIRITSHTNYTTNRAIYNNWAQQHYQGYPPSAVNIWMFIHFCLTWQAINHYFGRGPVLVERLTWDVVHHVVVLELVHHEVLLELVRVIHAPPALLQDEGGVVMKKCSLVAKNHWEWHTFRLPLWQIKTESLICFVAGHSCDFVVQLPRTGHC